MQKNTMAYFMWLSAENKGQTYLLKNVDYTLF